MPKNASESITIQLQCPRMHYEFVTNQARFFESGNSWPSFEQFNFFDPNFRGLRFARTDYGLYDSVIIKIFAN